MERGLLLVGISLSVCTNTLFKSPAGQQAPSPGAPGPGPCWLWEGGSASVCRAQQGEAWGLFHPSAGIFPKPFQGFKSLPNHSALRKAGSGGSQVLGGLPSGPKCRQVLVGAGTAGAEAGVCADPPFPRGGLGLMKPRGSTGMSSFLL